MVRIPLLTCELPTPIFDIVFNLLVSGIGTAWEIDQLMRMEPEVPEISPEACRQNVERDAREKGRFPEKRLQALEDWSPRYSILPTSPTVRVYGAANHQELCQPIRG